MSGQALWAFVIVLVLVAAGLGFFFGRVSNSGMKERLREAEEAVGRKDSELAAYRREVDAHFDKTATLFVSMAGSYKSLFEHLSSGYEKLSAGSSRDLFRERVATLLIDAPRQDEAAAEVDTQAPEAAEESVQSAAEAGPVTPAELAEAEEREAQRVDPVQADAEAAEAMQEERREPGEGAPEGPPEAAPRRD
ncbi:MAG: YhcB family protein [Pseudazoarcus pumilus]|nr:YhcB family protein [Pseudazoarcus pumilus]